MKIIPLNEYPKPNIPGFGNTRAGMHGTAFADLPLGNHGEHLLNYLMQHGFSWLKLLSRENGNVEYILDLAFARGFGVIVRMYRPEPNPGTLTVQQLNTLDRWGNKYAGKPLYIQFNNEPDLPDEWRNKNKVPNWLDIVAQNAITDCIAIQQRNLIPVLPPAATHSPDFYNYRLIPKILELNGSRIFDNKKIAFGVHAYTMGTPATNPPFPYDAINKEGRPLQAGEFNSFGDVWEAWGTDNPQIVNHNRTALKKPNADFMQYGQCASYLAYLHQYNLNIKDVLPGPIPVMELEGGEQVGIKYDLRYPRTNPDTRVNQHKAIHAELWNRNIPSWFFCTNSWLLDGDNSQWPKDGWFSGNSPRLPVYSNYFSWHKNNAKDCSSMYLAGGSEMIGFHGAKIERVGNFNSRPNNTIIDSIIVHATAGVKGQYGNSAAIVRACLSWWNNPASQASAHYIITKEGEIIQCVSEHLRAWHAGISRWDNPPREDFNHFSIGIELTNENDGIDPYPDAQIAALIELSRDIRRRHPRMNRNLYLAHRHISGFRNKTDPVGLNLEPIRIAIWNTPVEVVPVEKMQELAQINQIIRLNPGAALQSFVAQRNKQDGTQFVVTSRELELDSWIFQRYEDIETGARRIYFAKKGEWEKINVINY